MTFLTIRIPLPDWLAAYEEFIAVGMIGVVLLVLVIYVGWNLPRLRIRAKSWDLIAAEIGGSSGRPRAGTGLRTGVRPGASHHDHRRRQQAGMLENVT